MFIQDPETPFFGFNMIFSFTVTVDAPNAGGWQLPVEDGRSVQIDAPNLVIQQPGTEMVEMEVEEEHVAEEYDPMSFFAGPADLTKQEHEPHAAAGESAIIGKFDGKILAE